jgi:hypothetical protein
MQRMPWISILIAAFVTLNPVGIAFIEQTFSSEALSRAIALPIVLMVAAVLAAAAAIESAVRRRRGARMPPSRLRRLRRCCRRHRIEPVPLDRRG